MTRLKPPSPKFYQLFGILYRLSKDPFLTLVELQKRFGDLVYANIFGRKIYIVSHPDFAQHIFKDNNKNYFKRGMDFEEIRPLVGSGLLLSEGSVWANQRRKIGKEFSNESIKSFLPIIKVTTVKWLAGLGLDQKNTALMQDEFMQLTLELSALMFLGTQISEAKVFHDAIEYNGLLAEKRIRSGIRLPRSLALPSHRLADQKIKKMDEIIFRIIKNYKSEEGNERTNVLSRLINASKLSQESDAGSDRQLRDEVVTMLVTGHETSGSTLSWAFYNLAKYPDWQEKVYAELSSVLDESITMEKLHSLQITKAFLNESLRLFPTLANMDRHVQNDDVIKGMFISANATMNISIYLIHRHPDFWVNPLVFNPDRFLNFEHLKHPFQFIPFGKGPRSCIGEELAILEVFIILNVVLKSYRLELVNAKEPKIIPRITIYPGDGLPLKFIKR